MSSIKLPSSELKILPPLKFDPTTTRKFLSYILDTSIGITEIRIPKAEYKDNGFITKCRYSKTVSGWYKNIDDMLIDLSRVENISAYVTLNPVSRALIAKSPNILSYQDHTTQDANIECFRWWYTDIDSERPADISATDEELAFAVSKRDEILEKHPEIARCSAWGTSGNGAFILTKLPDYDNDHGKELVAKALDWLVRQYKTSEVNIDITTKNPSRLGCIPGTAKCKGFNIAERPYRLATLDSPFPEPFVLPPDFDLEGWLSNKQGDVQEIVPGENGSTNHAIGISIPENLRLVAPERILKRARACLKRVKPSISGQHGHNNAYEAACLLVIGFGLCDSDATILFKEWNAACEPPWSDVEIAHKIKEANENSDTNGRPRGYMVKEPVEEEIEDPHRLARIYRDNRCMTKDGVGLRFYRDKWMRWDGSAYSPMSPREINAYISETTKIEFDRVNLKEIEEWRIHGQKNSAGKKCAKPASRKVTTNLVGHINQALTSYVFLPSVNSAPFWLMPKEELNRKEIIPFKNCLFYLPTGKTYETTPLFFNTYALPYNFDPNAPTPETWLQFLKNIWGEDQESIDTLQEWFGYCLTPDRSQQKMLVMIGPKRAGKDTIARVLRTIIGEENAVGPTLSGMTSHFGFEPLIDKPLAIISDARISQRTDTAIIVERLLTATGCGLITIDRKHTSQWSGELPTKLVMISNELPKMPDSSGALASRMIVLRFMKSFYGKEDITLSSRLAMEIPGILLWAIEGWKRFRINGRFTQPGSGQTMVDELEDLSSPVNAFIRERCDEGPEMMINTKDLYRGWKYWCESVGKKDNSDIQTFSRNLRTRLPNLDVKQSKKGGKHRYFVGITLKTEFQLDQEGDGEPGQVFTYEDEESSPPPF